MEESATMLWAHAPVLRDLSRDLNFDTFLRTYTFRKIERRIDKMNRASDNYNEFNVG